MTVVYTPPPGRRAPRPPRWWQSIGRRAGTIFRHDGVLWRKGIVGDKYGTWVTWERVDSIPDTQD